MTNSQRRVPTVVTLLVGLGLGWLGAGHRPPVLKAEGSDRYGDYSLTTGTVSMQYNERTKVQSPQEALFFLDYRGAKLLATIPILRSSLAGSQILEGFVERDLAADFKLNLETGPAPHFLMTAGALGAYGSGYSPLFVFETTSKQVAVYRVQTQAIGTKSTPKFDMLQIKSYVALPQLPAPQP